MIVSLTPESTNAKQCKQTPLVHILAMQMCVWSRLRSSASEPACAESGRLFVKRPWDLLGIAGERSSSLRRLIPLQSAARHERDHYAHVWHVGDDEEIRGSVLPWKLPVRTQATAQHRQARLTRTWWEPDSARVLIMHRRGQRRKGKGRSLSLDDYLHIAGNVSFVFCINKAIRGNLTARWV